MKPRYLSLVLVSATTAVIAATTWLAGHHAWRIHADAASARAQSAALREIPRPDEQMSARMARYYADLGGLGRPRERESGGEVVFEILSFSAEAVADHHQEVRPPEENFDEHVVTLVLVTPRQRTAVIDGRTYREGDIIAGTEGRLDTITPERVLVVGREIRQWVEVENAMAPAIETAMVDDDGAERGPRSAAEIAARGEAQETGESDRQREIREGLEALLEYRRMLLDP